MTLRSATGSTPGVTVPTAPSSGTVGDAIAAAMGHLHAGHDGLALSALVEAAALDPDRVELQVQIGWLARRTGDVDAAERAYRQALVLDPRHAVAGSNLGALLVAQERFAEALRFLRGTLESNPGVPELHHNAGTCELGLGRPERAVDDLLRAVALRPTYVAALENLAVALMQVARYDDAVSALSTAVGNGLDALSARLAFAELASGDLTGAARRFGTMRPATDDPPDARRSRELQEREQREYLDRVRPVAVDAARDPGNAVLRPRGEWSRLDDELAADPDAFVVVDDLLTEEALEHLTAYLLQTPIWQSASTTGEVIATLDTGLGIPAVLRVSEELRLKMPRTVGGHCLTEAWAYHYRDSERYTRAHGDPGRYSVNIWLTPDHAYLGEPGRGGLLLWTDRTFEHATSLRSAAPQLLADMSGERESVSAVVPYRRNRAVIFNALTFHETDAFRFRPEFEHRRINMTFLFGFPGRQTDASTEWSE